MDASVKPNDDNNVDPNVNFLYRAMRERDPRKRRVKPVAHSLVQVNFGSYEDSEDDSDFDISKFGEVDNVGADSKQNDGQKEEAVQKLNEDGAGDEENGEDESESSDDSDDEGSEESEDEEESAEPKVSAKGRRTAPLAATEAATSVNNDNADVAMASDEVSEDEDDDDDLEETDEDGDVSDDEGEEEEEDEEEGDSQSRSPEEKGLGHILSMIDSDEDDEDYVPKKRKKKASGKGNKGSQSANKTTTKPTTFGAAQASGAPVDPDALWEAAPQGRIKVIVCCVCLSDRSADDDEIVECDNCGISVHEGCYGISESHSTASTESSASTEPWFCDACKADATPVCELCPNTGGIFKETDNGKWVHIVCALYTPGVAFGDVDRLALVTLYEMPYARWGARECSLCEDSRFSQTGVCINCDAGMCKAYFHVTCAQREGLLAEASPEEVMDIADPFFAYCKLHADKLVSKMKRRNWLAIQSQVKMHKPNLMVEEKEKMRFHRKLKRHREKYSLSKLKRPPTWLPTQKMVRHLHSSPSAVRGFLRKAELMGVITQSQTVPVEKQEARKKVQGQPQFTSEFINYFMDRNIKMDNLKQSLSELTKQKVKLQAQEKSVRTQYEKVHGEVNKLREKENGLRQQGESLCGMLADIYGKPVPNIPEIFKSKKRNRSPSKTEVPSSPTTLINPCGVCCKTNEQHLMAKCDSCKKHYHLGCLDPPLTRMPKKTKLFGWQCSFCVVSSSDESMTSAPNVDQPRRLRETIKEPDKFFHLSHIQDSLKSQQKKSLLSKKSKQRRMAAAKKVAKTSSSPTGITSSRPASARKKQPSPKARALAATSDAVKTPKMSASPSWSGLAGLCGGSEGQGLVPLDIMCVVCNKDGTVADTVRCDECMLAYHLLCLDPPMKKSPKVRGYAWHCEACDNMSRDSDEEPVAREVQEKKKEPATPSTKRPSGREASNSILFDIDVSSDELDN
ncbi:PHD finger protein 14 [Aplysia californica]|uniref:PHD finger protein 14 n=1 Tax=Aplysia californica TaxID=6500 RepID=A0ABM1ACQ6_APLCA|nr:PHD finger protein 14 [Aplysia californica]